MAVCSNGDELFSLKEGETWECNLDIGRFAELQQMLLGEPYGRSHGNPTRCESWCDCEYNKEWCSTNADCSGCQR